MKNSSIVFKNDTDVPHYISSIPLVYRNGKLAYKVRVSSASFAFTSGVNLTIRVVDEDGSPIDNADVSLIESELTFKGDWQPALEIPQNAVIGDCYRVTVAGDYGDDSWEVGDLAVIITGFVLEKRPKRFGYTGTTGFVSLNTSYESYLSIVVNADKYQRESHALRYEAGSVCHNVTMYPLVSVAHTPRGHCVSAAPADRGNNIYL